MTKDITLDELRLGLESLSPDNKKQAMEMLSKIGVDISKRRGDLTGTGVAGFILEEKFYEADSHKDMFIKIVEIISNKYPEKIDKLLEVRGTKKKYFSKYVGDFKHGYEQICGTKIYADTNENAAQLNRRCQRILQMFSINPSTLLVIPR